MRLFMAALSAAFLLATLAPAQAKHRHHHHRSVAQEYDGRVIANPAGCPRTAFCGCGASVRIFGKPIRNLYLASNWFKFPRANPAPGMAAVRNHHVMVIEAVDGNGNATVYDANSGNHQTRVHVRSLSGYKIVNPHGGSTYTYLPAAGHLPGKGIGDVS